MPKTKPESKPSKSAKEWQESKELITSKMPIGEVVQKHPETIEIFMKHGMHCIGCAAANFENIKDGCIAHGIDADALVEDLNKKIRKK